MRKSRSLQIFATLLVAGCSFAGAFLPVAQNSAKPNLQAIITSSSSRQGLRTAILAPAIVAAKDAPSTRASLSMASSSETDAEQKSWQFNPLYASLWVGFLTFAAVGPGEIGAPEDTAMIMSYIDNPADPGFSEAFQLIFNYLGIMPMIIACTAVPQATQRGLPPLPFLVSSFAMGYGGVGPYLSFRAPPREEYIPSEASWFTRNILESKLLGWGLVAGVIGLPFYVGLVDAISADASAAHQSYADLFATSKFVSASSMDALILNVVAASLIPRDLKLRRPEMEDSKGKLVGASTLLVPFLGAALYCALRPALPNPEQE